MGTIKVRVLAQNKNFFSLFPFLFLAMLNNSLPDFSSYGYQTVAIIGQNRQLGGATYLAFETLHNQEVVIKQFEFGQNCLSWSSQEAMQREAEILKQLDHPRIPRYLNFFQTPYSFCLVQEYKNAPSLAKARSFTQNQVKEIAISVLEILVYLQQRVPAIIHRDIKPENILVDEHNTAYLIDFGFSRIGGEEVSGSSVVKGTPGFMPPEQLWGRLTKASDLYSLGMTLICLLAGISSVEICKHINDDYCVNFNNLNLGVGKDFLDWLTKLVQPNPNKRYDDASIALEALQNISIFSSSSKFKQTSYSQKSTKLLGNKQFFTCLVFGLVLGVSWGIIHHVPNLGLCLGIIIGLGLSMILTIPRQKKSFLSIPSKQSIIGAILVAGAVGAIINPASIFYSQYIGLDRWNIQSHKVGDGIGFTLFSDVPNLVDDTRMLAFVNQFRKEVANYLFDPGKPSCATDIHLLREDKNYFAIANRFNLKTPYGFFLDSILRPNAIVVRQQSGLGTLTHQMMYHYLSCSYPEGLPVWATQGVATFVEKFVAFEKNNRINFSWGYRSNWRDPDVRQLLSLGNVNLANELRQGKQQSLFHSFFLFLHHQGQLIPLLNRLHGEHGDGIDRIEQIFNKSMAQVDADWQKWLETEALSLPMVESSFVVWGDKTLEIEKYLQKYWVWNDTKQMWLIPKKSPWILIPTISQ